MGYLWKSEDQQTEVSLGFLVDAQGVETGVAVLEIVTPVYHPYSSQYDHLMRKMQDVRQRVFGWQQVVDLSTMPLEVGVTLKPDGKVNVFTIYEELTHRNRYVFVGIPKKDFNQRDMHWEEHLAIAAPVTKDTNNAIQA
jgi:hypothetical protein